MMGERQSGQASLFYTFSLESHVPEDHLRRVIDKFADLGFVREHLKDYYSHTGRPSIDPELMIRMLLVGYCYGNNVDEAGVAVSWLLAHPANIIPVMGANSLARIQALVQAYKVKMDWQMWFELYGLAKGKNIA